MFMDRKEKYLQPSFVSTCVFRVRSSRGEDDYGTPVFFGNLIQLELMRSGQLLTASTDPCERAQKAYSPNPSASDYYAAQMTTDVQQQQLRQQPQQHRYAVAFEDKPNTSEVLLYRMLFESCFEVMPEMKIRAEGELAHYGEPLLLVDNSKSRYLGASPYFIDAGKSESKLCASKNNQSISTQVSETREKTQKIVVDEEKHARKVADKGNGGVVWTSETKQSWRLLRYRAYDPSLDNLVKGGDLIRLYHVDKEAFLIGAAGTGMAIAARRSNATTRNTHLPHVPLSLSLCIYIYMYLSLLHVNSR